MTTINDKFQRKEKGGKQRREKTSDREELDIKRLNRMRHQGMKGSGGAKNLYDKARCLYDKACRVHDASRFIYDATCRIKCCGKKSHLFIGVSPFKYGSEKVFDVKK